VPAAGAQELRSNSSTAEGATFLLVPEGARAVGMAGAVTASRGQLESLYWNPAGIARLEGNQLYYNHSNDFGTDSNIVGFIWQRGLPRFGFSYHSFDFGSINATDATGGQLGSLDVRNQAFQISIGIPLLAGLDVGATYKLVQFISDCRGVCSQFDLTATAHAFDVGAILALPMLPGVDVGVLIRNAGTNLTLADGGASDPLPTRIRFGGSLDVIKALVPAFPMNIPLDIRVQADFEEPFSEFDDLDAFFGAEVGVARTLFVRLGYAAAGQGRTGAALGVGLAYRQLRIDFGRSFDDFSNFDGNEPFQLSVGLGL